MSLDEERSVYYFLTASTFVASIIVDAKPWWTWVSLLVFAGYVDWLGRPLKVRVASAEPDVEITPPDRA